MSIVGESVKAEVTEAIKALEGGKGTLLAFDGGQPSFADFCAEIERQRSFKRRDRAEIGPRLREE